jgi:hypothetical protein
VLVRFATHDVVPLPGFGFPASRLLGSRPLGFSALRILGSWASTGFASERKGIKWQNTNIAVEQKESVKTIWAYPSEDTYLVS